MEPSSVQETYAPHNECFGCGPSNTKGLRLRSMLAEEGLVCDWTPSPEHLAFPGVLNGGICGALLDCHSNWTAAMHLMKEHGLATPPCTVTAEFAVKLRRPDPARPRPPDVAGRLGRRGPGYGRRDARVGGQGDRDVPGSSSPSRTPAFHRW